MTEIVRYDLPMMFGITVMFFSTLMFACGRWKTFLIIDNMMIIVLRLRIKVELCKFQFLQRPLLCTEFAGKLAIFKTKRICQTVTIKI